MSGKTERNARQETPQSRPPLPPLPPTASPAAGHPGQAATPKILRIQLDDATAAEGEAIFRAKERGALAADDWIRKQVTEHPDGKSVDADRDTIVYDPWTGRAVVQLKPAGAAPATRPGGG